MRRRRQGSKAIDPRTAGIHQELQRLQVADATIREERERFRVTLRSIGDAVMVTDSRGRITFMNPVAEAVTRWSELEAAGRPLDEVFRIVNEKTRAPVESPVTRVLHEGTVVGLANHTVLLTRDGLQVPIDDSGAPIRTEAGELVGVVLVFRDVTERRRAEEAEFRLAAIIHSSDDAIISKDLNGIIRSWNPTAERLFGFTSQEAVGRSITIIIPPERLAEEDEVLRRLRRGEAVDHFETVRVRKDGTRIDISLTTSPVTNAAGEIIGASKIARDISERKRTEAERATLLERERAARAEAEAANHAKDEFLAMLGHELRNPLGAIASAVAVLDRIGKQEDETTGARAVIARQARHLTRLVDDLLDVARVTSGKIRLNRAPVELGGLVERSLHAFMAAGRVRHHVQVHVQPVWIDADEIRIEQVLTNLVENAVKFTPPGGETRVRVRRDEATGILEVTDTGLGIPADLLPRIFDLFAQGERTLDRVQGGLGLGLTLVRRLVALHGGTVSAASEGSGQGATFTVRLPAIEAPEVPHPDVGPAVSAVSRRRILVIEDNTDGRQALRMLLTLEGHDVDEAEDGITGIEKALARRPDVIIVDIGLPGLNGYAVARRIRAAEGGHRPMLVALSGYGQPEDRHRAEQAGFDAYLVKPVTLEALARVIAAGGSP